MSLSQASDLESLLSEIQNWGEVPPPAIDHVIANKARLPMSFYDTQSRAELYSLAQALPNYDAAFVSHIMAWPQTATGGLKALEFYLETVFFTLCNPAFAKDGQFPDLYVHLCIISKEFLGRLYHPNLDREDVAVLPDLHRFLCHLLQAQTAADQKQWSVGIASLRNALTAMPSAKPIVEFQMHVIQRQAATASASDELCSLAQQIQSLLSCYAPDDPVVDAIRKSDAYQKVAYLIEGIDAPIFGGLSQ